MHFVGFISNYTTENGVEHIKHVAYYVHLDKQILHSNKVSCGVTETDFTWLSNDTHRDVTREKSPSCSVLYIIYSSKYGH